ncbi:hypothetical protein RCH18_002171 [Flavobacterium sp. PL11]|uniref:EpsG family protein n=1 Tax=Flavobacterium sp. PL11 TaxID=3071717 RepID=UPI002E06337A|nr:hypothetical protein [Flavobacterium sp. PL11]
MFSINNNKSIGENQENSGYLLLVFLIWPFIAFAMACSNFKNNLNKKIILAFFALYGILYFLNPAMDGQRRADGLKIIAQEPLENLFYTFENLYEETLDFAEPLLMFLISRFSDFHGVLFGIYALIFGVLMLYYLNRMYLYYLDKKSITTLLFFTLLVCANPINNIGGFRMWAAAWIFAIGLLGYLQNPKNKYLVLAACSFLIHFSFLPVVILSVIYSVFKNRPKIYGLGAIATFFVAELNIESVRQYAAFFGTASQNKVGAYTGESYIENLAELATKSAWYIDFINYGLKYFVLISLLVVFLKTKGQFKNKIIANFFSFTLMLLSFANISSLLPSGSRFYVVFYIFAFSTLLLYYAYETDYRKTELINRIGIPIVVLYVIFTFRLFSDNASVYLFGPSFMMPFGILENVSLQSILF